MKTKAKHSDLLQLQSATSDVLKHLLLLQTTLQDSVTQEQMEKLIWLVHNTLECVHIHLRKYDTDVFKNTNVDLYFLQNIV